ncbi:MAG: peptide/nickel transport system ATP-binding protein [Gammaproteobacteria bacterium]|nr:MAG: peptide/nickel transport system ATP-binding protein [Gammaproteobacteria bacterium]TND04997.1 MAG: peptide/nickel transport system ATP-binding protein [Gammaproteobacteria bacterium]
MSDKLLSVQGLQTCFQTGGGTVRAVDGVDFDIHSGETFALLGESGCGKSMTALSILRLVPQPAGRITAGKVLLDGQDLLALPEHAMRDVRGKRIAMIFQEPMTSLNPVLTIGMQIGETVERHLGLRGKALRDRVIALLDDVGIPDPAQRYGEYPHQLSGGMKQRVMIAIALAGEPQLLIADEPTTALDVTIQAQILDLLRKLQRERGMAMLLITHDLGVVAGIADRVAVMYAGHIVEQADRAAFFADPKHPYSRKLFESLPTMGKRDRQLAVIKGSVPSLAREFRACRFEDRCDFAWQTCRDTAPRWLAVGPEHHARCHLNDPDIAKPAPRAAAPAPAIQQAPRATAGDVLVDINDLQVFFPIHKGLFKRTAGHVRAVDGVSLQLRVGRTLALVGESGCGKTTAGKGLLQLIRPTAGTVHYRGNDLTQIGARRMRPYRADLQIIFQDPYSSMNPRMMVADIIEEGMLAQRIGRTDVERQARIDELLTQVGLSPEAKRRYPHEFSGGQRQRICIARALAVNPKLIVCDEPTSALDVSVQAQILNLLKRLQAELGLSYLFITHNLAVVEYLADEVAVMYLGRIVERGTVADVMQNPCHPYTQALLSAIPKIDTATGREIIKLEGDLPSPSNPPRGCHFHPRCPMAMEVCRGNYPERTTLSDTHTTHCYLYR